MLCGLPSCPRCRTQVDEDQLRILINFDILFWSSWKFIIHIKTIISFWSYQAQYVLYLTTRSRYQETLALALSFISSFHANDFHQLCNWEFWSRAWHIYCVWMQKSAEMRGAVDSGIIPLCVINILIAFVFVGKCEKNDCISNLLFAHTAHQCWHKTAKQIMSHVTRVTSQVMSHVSRVAAHRHVRCPPAQFFQSINCSWGN